MGSQVQDCALGLRDSHAPRTLKRGFHKLGRGWALPHGPAADRGLPPWRTPIPQGWTLGPPLMWMQVPGPLQGFSAEDQSGKLQTLFKFFLSLMFLWVY